ncbi:MAG: hypothetical protein KGL35_30215, partial [Bradyrhizobium sp.]|nr:hypothetical protein [Bradyrhizobium sp.]
MSTTIAQLPVAAPISDSDLIPVAQGSVDAARATASALATYAATAMGSPTFNTAARRSAQAGLGLAIRAQYATYAAMVADASGMISIGDTVQVLAGFGNAIEAFSVVAAATLTPTGTLVQNLTGLGLQAVSLRLDFASSAEFTSDPRTNPAGCVVRIPSEGKSYIQSGSGTTLNAASQPYALIADTIQTAAATITNAANVSVNTAAISALQGTMAAAAMTWPTTAAGLGQGIAGVTAIVGGSGGANGTFALAFTGGTQVLAPVGVFTVAGGALVSVTITYPGYYSAGTPALSFAASTGLAGAGAVAQMAANTPVNGYFSVPSTVAGEAAIVYRNVAGVATEAFRTSSTAAITALQDSGYALRNGVTLIGSIGQIDLGLDASVGEWVYNTVVGAAGLLQYVKGHAQQAGTLTIHRYKKVGANFIRQAGYGDAALTIAAAGPFAFTGADFGRYPLEAGDYVGFTCPVTPFLSDMLITGATGYSFSATLGATSIPVGSSTSLLVSIGFGVPVQDITHDRLLSIDARSSATQAALAALTTTRTETIGVSGTPAAGLSGGSLYLALGAAASRTGTVDTADHYAMVAGSIEFCVFARAGNVFTLVSSVARNVVVGLNTGVAVGLPIQAGQYVGIHNTTTGVLTTLAASNWSPGYYGASALSGGAFTAATRTTGAAIQTRFSLSAAAIALGEGDVLHPVTLKGSDRIAVFGDSYSGGYYGIRGKNWVPKLSAETDFNVENFAISGDTFASQLTKLRTGIAPYGPLPPQAVGATYGWIMLGRNDQAGGLTAMVENARQMIQTVRGLGMIPILSTEWIAIFGTQGSLALRALAENEGAIWFDSLPNTTKTNFGVPYLHFFGGTANHPGTRTSDIISNPAVAFVNSLPRPRQSVKYFRKRGGVTVGTIQDLMFDRVFDRLRLWREINVGQFALAVASENWYDKLENPDPVTGAYAYNDLVTSEYQTFMSGGTVSFADYGLIDVILPALQRDVDSIAVTLSDPSVSLWYRN